MHFDSLKKLFSLSVVRTRHTAHHAVIAPYRHWAIMLGVASVSVVASMSAGAFLFFMVSGEQMVEAPQVETPERLIDQARLRATLERARQRHERYEELRGPLPESSLEVEEVPAPDQEVAEDGDDLDSNAE